MESPSQHQVLCPEQSFKNEVRHSVQYETIQEVPDSSSSLQSSEEDVQELGSVSPDIDGGYGWVVLAASFMVAFLVDGVGSSFGLLLPFILERFESSTSLTVFAGSFFGAFTIMGSVSAELVKKFGFRAVAMVGGGLTCLAFVIAAFSPNIYVFILSYGLMGGCSCGLVFVPSIVIVNEYFHQKRGVANGIICSGSGVGLLVLAPVINLLLDTYNLSGTVLVLAGVLLHMTLCGCLYRPPSQVVRHMIAVSQESDQEDPRVTLVTMSSDMSTDDDECLSVVEPLVPSAGSQWHPVKSQFDINQIFNKYLKLYFNKAGQELQPSSCQAGDQGQTGGSRSYAGYLLSHLQPQAPAPKRRYTLAHGSRPAGPNVRKLQSKHLWKSMLDLESKCFPQIGKFQRSYSMYDMPTWCQDHDKKQILLNITKQLKQKHPEQPRRRSSHGVSRRHSRSVSIDHGSNYYLAGSISTLMNLQNSFMHSQHGSTSGSKTLHDSGLISRVRHTSASGSARLLRQDSRMTESSAAFEQDRFVPTSMSQLSGTVYPGSKSGSSRVLYQDHMGSKSGSSRLLYQDLMGSKSGSSRLLYQDLMGSKNGSSRLLYHDGRASELTAPQHVSIRELHRSSASVVKPAYTGLLMEEIAEEDSELSEPEPTMGFSLGQLLCMPSFHAFCLGASLIQIGYPLAGTFLADYAYQLKLTTSHTAVLMGLLGGLNICGRLLSGVLVSLQMDPLHLNNLSLVLGGAACLISPLYTQFWSLALFASLFGFFLGFFPPLQPLIIVKHFGLGSLSSAFGFLNTVKGVASVMGTPLAGCIYELTGMYSVAFMFGGAVFILSALVHYLMLFPFNRLPWNRRSEELKTQV